MVTYCTMNARRETTTVTREHKERKNRNPIENGYQSCPEPQNIPERETEERGAKNEISIKETIVRAQEKGYSWTGRADDETHHDDPHTDPCT